MSEEYLAGLFLLMSDHERYATLKLDLRNDFLKGIGEYKKRVIEMKKLMADFDGGGVVAAPRTTQTQSRARNPSLAFIESHAWTHPECFF